MEQRYLLITIAQVLGVSRHAKNNNSEVKIKAIPNNQDMEQSQISLIQMGMITEDHFLMVFTTNSIYY